MSEVSVLLKNVIIYFFDKRLNAGVLDNKE